MNIINSLEDFFKDYSNKDNLVCVLTYGSVVNQRFNKDSDIDIYILLKTFNEIDYDLLMALKKDFDRKLDITIEYQDNLDPNPNKFISGPNDCFALSYLSSAYVIYGNNIFRAMREKIDYKHYKMSIFRKIVDYNYRVRTFIIDQNSKSIEKYVSRIMIDILLIKEPESDMSRLKKLTKKEVISMFDDKEPFCSMGYKNVSTEDYLLMAKINNDLLEIAKEVSGS